MSVEQITHVLKLQTAATLMAVMSVCAGQDIIRCQMEMGSTALVSAWLMYSVHEVCGTACSYMYIIQMSMNVSAVKTNAIIMHNAYSYCCHAL